MSAAVGRSGEWWLRCYFGLAAQAAHPQPNAGAFNTKMVNLIARWRIWRMPRFKRRHGHGRGTVHILERVGGQSRGLRRRHGAIEDQPDAIQHIYKVTDDFITPLENHGRRRRKMRK